ncbi:MAG TPA: transcription termination/antitermination protein NusG [bacterium]|nr:transcription termination/antitermination protein NusG [bacterium]
MSSGEMKWYVVHTYSGFENKAKEALEERIKRYQMEEKFAETLIPSEEVVELVGGKRKVSQRKFFPGYMLVRMVMDDETFHLVKNTPKVTGFVGGQRNPPAIPDDEAERLTRMIADDTLRPKAKDQFERGEIVRVVDGPFRGFNGIVDEAKPEKSKVKVLVSIFGRQTPVELDFVQVEKG